MKKIILTSMAAIFSTLAVAQEDSTHQMKGNQNDLKINNKMRNRVMDKSQKYCAMLLDGKITLTSEGKEIYTDILLVNGTKIKTDGTVVGKDGTETMLKNGECVDRDGKIEQQGKKK
jgi:c-di-GMP-binding flagellar brake protein YcgR